ncbi:S9 family peptidase [Sphingobacterium sp. lm-10]|uniref:S9 family peptidase n=1 Tax=Sphingobacterium sp. lm-10 TaxID=2944904 RepID=UPI002021063A|nr:DPP IV N-terminal domain-containing protein [Sphingobacterium sp. lm-10]MCL7987978.1 S9 family peptidase [Sphingobacterium sp. lm-10]
MYKLSSIAAVMLCFLAVGKTEAQTRKLNYAQSWGQEASLTNPIRQYRGWADADHYIVSEKNVLSKVNVKTGAEAAYSYPADESTKVSVDKKDVVITFADGQSRQLTQSPDIEEKNPTLSPDGKFVAFTRDNDLYAVEVESGKEMRYTTDGSDVVYNGWSSWVYYEEILGRSTNYKAFWWSPDSKRLAFMRFDDSQVPMFPIYASPGQHGYVEKTRYPKAGDKNPAVRVGFVEVAGSPVVWAAFNEEDDQYFGQPYWSFNSQSIMVQWMNRDQTNLKFYQVNPIDGSKVATYDEMQPTWINLDHDERITYLADNKHYILKSDKTGWAHYYLYNLDGKLVNALTNGDWQVSSIAHIDEKNKVFYFTARKENSATSDLYRVNFNGKNFKRLTFGNYTHRVKVSPNGKHFITEYSNVETPTKVALVDMNGKMIRELEDSKSADFDQYTIGKTAYFTIPSADGQYDLPVIVTYPTDFDETKEYPVIMSIYGGPDAGSVRNTWKGTAKQYWANEGIIQIECDHRASGHFGKEGVALMHRKLGHWELIDYGTIAQWLKAKPWVAKNKLLITGHSYGGYVVCMALTKGSSDFDYGIAGAPVTSWELYDSHYTERWMDTPQDNPEGYKDGSVLTHVNGYKGVLRLMHGDLDDNVHLQNSIQLVDALTDRDIPFEFMIYPGSRHGFERRKSAYDFKERVRFYYEYLLEKPVPKELK